MNIVGKTIKVKIDGMYNILGRGWILFVCDDRLSNTIVPYGSTVTVDGKVFTIIGTERAAYGEGWFSPSMGIRLRPNDHVKECFREGQEIEIEIKER